MHARFATIAIALAVATTTTLVGVAQAPSSTPPLVIKSVYGRDLYEFYCATCHGRDGRGGGPVAPALTTAPSDLTGLAAEHGGSFPRERLIRYIAEGGELPAPAHGSKDMPVWGPIFRGLDPSDTMATIRVENVVDYIATLQRTREK